MNSSNGGRSERREATIAEIKQRALRQLNSNGHGGLSLRAVARDMGLSSPAIYRYFPNHNDVITALCVDAFTALADALEAAESEYSSNEPRRQLRAVFMAMRRWALDNPAEYSLTFGTPIPGYDAPAEATGPASIRIATALVRPYVVAVRTGLTRAPRVFPPQQASPDGILGLLLGQENADVTMDMLVAAHNAAVSVLGFIGFESWGNLHRYTDNSDLMFNAHVDTVLDGMGFEPTADYSDG